MCVCMCVYVQLCVCVAHLLPPVIKVLTQWLTESARLTDSRTDRLTVWRTDWLSEFEIEWQAKGSRAEAIDACVSVAGAANQNQHKL